MAHPQSLPDAIANQGFAIIPGIFGEDEVSTLSAALAGAPLQRSRAGVRHALQHPPVARLAHHPRLVEIARSVLGAWAVPFGATLFDKSPTSNWLVVWHQDTALPLRKRQETQGWGPWSVKEGVIYAHAPASALNQVLALRIHLDDSTAQNGPLRVLPGTHQQGVLSDDAISELAGKVSPFECPVPKGGVLAMRPLLVHASSKSQSESARRVLHIEYAARGVTADGLELRLTNPLESRRLQTLSS